MNDLSTNNKDRHFKGQYADEEVVAFFRSHWIILLPHLLIHAFFLAVFVAVFVVFFPFIISFFITPLGEVVMVVAVICITYFIHRFFIRLVTQFLHTVIITNFRIVEIEKFILFKDVQLSLDMKMIQDIEKEQNGFWKNILNFGELIIMMSSSDIRVLKYVPNPDFHFRLINRIKRAYVQKRFQDKIQDRPQHSPILHENLTFPGVRISTPDI